MSSRHVGNGFVAKFDPQLGENACHLEVALASIFVGLSHKEPFNFLVGTGLTALPV